MIDETPSPTHYLKLEQLLASRDPQFIGEAVSLLFQDEPMRLRLESLAEQLESNAQNIGLLARVRKVPPSPEMRRETMRKAFLEALADLKELALAGDYDPEKEPLPGGLISRSLWAFFWPLFADEKLIGIAKNILRHYGEDIIAEALQAARERFIRELLEGKYDPAKSGVITRMVAFAIRKAATLRRGSGRRGDREKIAGQPGSVHEPSSEGRLMQDECTALLHGAIAQLDNACQELLFMHYVEGIQWQTIAETNGENPPAVRMRAMHCRAILKEIIINDPEIQDCLNLKKSNGK